MRGKRKKAIVGSIILIMALFAVCSLDPSLAIRRYILLHGQPINSAKAEIVKNGYHDAKYGELYDVTGYMDPATRDELGVFYLKKKGILWYVASVGTGP